MSMYNAIYNRDGASAKKIPQRHKLPYMRTNFENNINLKGENNGSINNRK
jgi:hypothetical protein